MMDKIRDTHQQHGVAIKTLCEAIAVPKASYYRHQRPVPVADNKTPHNKLTTQEEQQVLALLHSEAFMDATPYKVFYSLLDQGEYYCSISTMYRLLAELGETQERRDQRQHYNAVKPELVAQKPNQVWSWDITKLKSSDRLVYYYLYVILDIYSRYVVGWLIADKECQQLAHRLIQQSALRQGIQAGQLTLHADNGPSMRSYTVAELLTYLGIVKTHSRPYTSDDNPYSESQFKTLKYCPSFPGTFDSLAAGRTFCRTFFHWYNNEHYHSGIAWLTPHSVHYGLADQILEKRYESLYRETQSI